MTGLSVLFNMNTEEACYIYGNMDTYRKGIELSLQKYTNPGRTRTYGDTNYSSSTTNSGRPYAPHYRDKTPYLSRSHYGFSSGSSLPQHDFPSYSSLGGSTYSDGSMSRYTRPYDTGSRNYDTSTRLYDSSTRLHDRNTRLGVSGSEEATESANRRYGLHAARGHDPDLKSYDGSSRKYDTGGTGSDIASGQPTSFGSGHRDSSTDHPPEPSLLDPGLRKTIQRHRNGSGDSLGSQSSDRSETKSQDSTDLFKIYRSRYQDRATHGQEPVSASYKEPSVSYSVPKKQTNLDIDPTPELESVEKAQNGERAAEKERSESLRTRWNSRSSSREEREDSAVNQRLSEKLTEGKLERSDSLQSRDTQSRSDAAQYKNVQSKSDSVQTKDVHSKTDSVQTKDLHSKSDSVQTKDVYSRSSIKDRENITAASSRLLEKNKEGVEIIRFRDWKSTKKETAELLGEPQGTKQSSDKSGDELLSDFRKAIRKHASTDDKKEQCTESSRSSAQLDKSIYSGDSKLEEMKESDNQSHKISQKKFEIEEVSSSDQGKGVSRRYQQSESMASKSKETGGKMVADKKKERIAFEGPVIDGRSAGKAYSKSKPADLGLLFHDTKKDEVDSSTRIPSRDAASFVATHSRDELSEMTREERISRYKEERKKQLAALAETFDSGRAVVDALPSLFLSQTSQVSPLARSQSLKAETDLQAAVALSRSRSMKEDSEKLKLIEDEKKQRINIDKQEYRLSEDKIQSQEFVDDDHIPSPSFKPLGITGLSLAERASEILGADQLPKKAPLDSRLFDHMQNLRKLQQKHRAKERISIDELKAKRLSRDTEDLDAMQALSIKEAKEEREKEKLQLRVDEKRQKDEKAEIIAVDSEQEKQKSRTRRKLPSLEDILGTCSSSSTPDTTQSSSPAHVGSLSSQSSLSTQSTSSQKLSSRTSSSGSEVSTSRASSSLSDASRCSRIPTPSTISEDVFHDAHVRKMDAQDQKDDQALAGLRSRTPSGQGQPISDSAKQSSDHALSHHKVTETTSTRAERNKAQEVKPFGTVYLRPKDKDQHQEEQKQSVKIPVTKISYRDLEKKERETKSSHTIEKETKHPTATESKYMPSSDSNKTQKEQTQQVLSSKEQEKSKLKDEKKQDFVTVEKDLNIVSKHIESGRTRYLENILKTSDTDSILVPSKKDFGVSYIGTGTEESSAKDGRKNRAQDVNVDPDLLLGKTPISLDSVDGDGKKKESKIRGKQVEAKSMLHDSSRTGSVKQTEVETKERIAPSSSLQSLERGTKYKSDFTTLALHLEKKESQKSLEKEPANASHLVSSSSVSFHTKTDEQQRPEAKRTISQKGFDKSRKEFGEIGFPSVSYQRRTPERKIEPTESEPKQPMQQAGIDMVKQPIQQAGIDMVKQPIQQAGINIVKQPIQQTGIDKVKQPIQQAGIDMVKQPIQQAGTDMVKQPIQQAGIDMVKQPIQQAGTDMVKQPIQQAGIDMVKQPIQQAGIDMVKQPIQQAGIDMVKQPIQQAGTDMVKQPMQWEPIDVGNQPIQHTVIDMVKPQIKQAGIDIGKQLVQQTGRDTVRLIDKNTENKTDVDKPISDVKVDEKSQESKTHLLSSKKTPAISDLKVEIKSTADSVKDTPVTEVEKKIEIPETRTVKLSRKPRIGEDTKVPYKYLASREAPVVYLPRKDILDGKDAETQIQRKEVKPVAGTEVSTEESSVVQDQILLNSAQGGIVDSAEKFTQPVETVESKEIIHEENLKSVHHVPKSNIEEYDTKPEKPIMAQIKPASTVSQITFQTLKSKTVHQNEQETSSESRIHETLQSTMVPPSFEKIFPAETVPEKHHDESGGALKILANLEDGKAEALSRVNHDSSVFKKDMSITPTIPSLAQPIDARLKEEDAKTPTIQPSSLQTSKDVKEMVVEVPVPPATVEFIRTLTVSSGKEKSASVERKPSKGKKLKPKLASEKKKELTEQRAGGSPLTLLDTTLDDILGKNLEYLSDVEALEIFSRKSKAEVSTRPKSIHEESSKRSLKKRALKKSKSMPEQAGLPIENADEINVIPKDPVQVISIEPGLADVKITNAVPVYRHAEAVEIKPEATTSSEKQGHVTLTDESRLIKSGAQTVLSSDKKSGFKVENQSRSEKFKDGETYSFVSKEAIDAQTFAGGLAEKSQLISRVSIEPMPLLCVDNTKPSEDAKSTGEIIKAKGYMSLSDVVSSQNKDVTTSLTPVTCLDDVTSRMEGASFYSDTQTSDASDRSEKHRARAQDMDLVKEEIFRLTTTDSDSLSQASYSSQTSDASRKKRKDKTAQRKSKLNEGADGDDSRGRSIQRPGSPKSNKTSLRKTSFRAVADKESIDKTVDSHWTEEGPTTSVKHESTSQLTKPIPSDMATLPLHSKVSNTEGSSSSSLHGRAIQTPILSSQTVLPSKFALPSKVSAAITKLSEAKESSQKKDDELSKSPKRIARVNNFSKLLEKFSSSDASSSEKSDHDSSTRRKLPLRRQEAYAISSGSSDEAGTRRTPERTQSFKIQGSSLLEENQKDTSLQRSSSFKSEFMKRRFSPEPLTRRQLPEIPVPSDKPSEELANVLDRRSHIVDEQQTLGKILEREKIHDTKVEKAEQFSSAQIDEVIADSEVAFALKARQKGTHPSTIREVELKGGDEAKGKFDRVLAAGMEQIKSESKVLSASQSQRRETDYCLEREEKENVDKPDESRLVKNMSSQSSVHVTSSISSPSLSVAPHASLRSHLSSQSSQKKQLEKGIQDPIVSEHKINKDTSESKTVKQTRDHLVLGPKINESVPNVPKLDLSAIDTSLDVLNQVTNEIDRKYNQDDPLHSKGAQLSHALSKIHVDSPREVVQFIKSVQNEQVSVSSHSFKADSFEKKTGPITSDSEFNETTKHEMDFKRESSPRIENTAKKDIIKMFSREVTPDRSSPNRNVPVKVTTSFQESTSSSGLKRTESAGRAESMDRPKGILKRSPSLKQSGVIVDPELASIMKSRRARQGDMEEEVEWKTLTALEDIKQAREQKLQQKAGCEEDEEKIIPISERIFHMENKIEEAKSTPVTPKSRSGLTTPKSVRDVSGTVTPKSQFSFDEGPLSVHAMVSDQLVQKLTNLKEKGSAVTKRREAFQKRKHDDWRTRTQPVTQEEFNEADGLESVRKFRLEILKKASSNVFEQIQHQVKPVPEGVKTEYPQLFRKDDKKSRCSRLQRHKTLPVTAAELGAIPEDKSLTTISFQQTIGTFGMRDSKGDSGILSGSEADSIIDKESSQSDSLRSLDTDLPDDDPSKLSVLAKATMFQKIEKTRSSASGAKRYIARKKRERSKTQPVTEEEVKTAAEIADNEKETEYKEEEQEENGEEKGEKEQEKREEEDLHDELSRRSLADKVKLFSSLKDAEEKAAQKTDVPPVIKKRNRKLHPSRFATQPITVEEVEKASKISPLAMSLVKPPDPELLRGLSFQTQRDIMARHAEVCLSQPGSRSGSQHTSTIDLTEELKSTQKGVLKPVEILENIEDKSTLKESYTSSDKEIEGELKAAMEKQESKKSKLPEDLEHERKGILKVKDECTTVLEKSEVDQPKEKTAGGILKMESVHNVTTKSTGILKTESADSSITKSILTETKSVLKTESLFEKIPETRGILKKESSLDTKKIEPDKPILKTSGSSENKESTLMKGILKKKEVEEEDTGSSEEYVLAREENLSSPSPDREETGREIDIDTPKGTDDDKTSRRRFRDRKGQTERYKTQPAEVTPEGTPQSDGGRKKMKYSGRHLTQPVTPEEKKEAEIATEMVEVKNSGSLAERLNALKKSGDEEWKKRVSRDLDLDQLKTPSPVRMREKKEFSTPRPSSIADRLTLLKSAGEDWRGRIEEKDVKQFTVAHKIESSGHGVTESPLVARLKKTPRSEISLKDFDSGESSDFPSPTTPTKESSKIPLPKEVIFTTEVEIEGKSGTIPALNAVTEESQESVQVEIPKFDEELDSFFHEQSTEVRETTSCTVDDFDELFIMANEILTAKRKIKPKRKHTTSGRNPLKTMLSNLEVRSEYTEVIRGVAEKELKRVKTSQIAQHAGFAVEALAGLASKENFAKVELRKTEASAATPGPMRYEPYHDLMLLHIKGRRRVQTRLVEPCAASLNSGDCYILVTTDQIIQWNGDYSNVIEKAKAADVADYIKQKKDLGCKNAQSVTVLEEKKSNICGGLQFWKALGGSKPYMGSGPTEEDELYENHIVETNMVYRLDNNSLVPVEDYWGNVPKYDMLKSDEIFVFDYGSELYVWQGKTVKPGHRKIGMKLARQLWDKGYDYSACNINPVSPLRAEESGGLAFKSPTRPPWAIFGKVNENMETILFREKFSDWPDTSRLIKVKSQEEISETKEMVELTPYDARLMLAENISPVTLVLEGSHVGRGTKWFEDMEGFVREVDIVTLDVVVWHILEYDHYKIPDHSYGQFHEGDTYVVRWQYMITTSGAKDLKGQQSKISYAGRERCAYFFWQGKSSTINEKGASALMTVELDEERGPQIRVSEGKEPPCFLNLFKGNMIIHIGKREDETTNTTGAWRFYSVRNELENEICLLEVTTNMSSLRSRSSFLVLNVNTGLLYVWHGCKSPQHTRKLAVAASNKLKEKCPLEVGLHQKAAIVVIEMEEGEEKLEFWRLMDVLKNDRSAYFSLLKDPRSFTHTLRLFHMTSVSGVFEVQEILNPSRTRDYFSPFPVIQADLYKASQPGLFLVDSGFEVYLWQGWWPEGDKEQENVHTGSAVARLNIDRKCALETTLSYCREKEPGSSCKAYVVYGGLEPLKFTNLFPFWTVDEAARESNLKDGKKEVEELVEELLERVSRTRFTFAELQEYPLPEGVNPLKLEWYLSDEEFMDVIEMSKEEFYALPAWKQTKIKQQVGLF